MKYLTVGTKELKNNMLYEVEDVENFNALKPRGGLWLSEQNENLTYNRWIDYLIEHPYTLRRKSKNNEIFIQPCTLVSLKEVAKIFRLETPEQYAYLINNYPHNSGKKFSYEDLSVDYDGIFVNIDTLTRLTSDWVLKENLDRFSINSLILFNLDCIDYYQSGEVHINPFKLEDDEDYYYDLKNNLAEYNYEIKIEDEKKKIEIKNNDKTKKRVRIYNEKIIH